MSRHVKNLLKQLRRTARALDRQAERCRADAEIVVIDRATRLPIVDRATSLRNAAAWRGRARACYAAMRYIEQRAQWETDRGLPSPRDVLGILKRNADGGGSRLTDPEGTKETNRDE